MQQAGDPSRPGARPLEAPSGSSSIVIVRGPFVHDARVLRAARVLRDTGLRPLIVAAVTTSRLPRAELVEGMPVVRVARHRIVARLQDDHGAAAPGRPTTGARPFARRAALRSYRLVRTADYYARAIRLVARERPGLIHCNDYSTMWVGVAAKLLCGSRVLYDSHELWPDRNGRWEWRPWLLASEAIFTRVADQVVTASPGYAVRMGRRYRMRAPAVVRNIPEGRRPPAVTGPEPGTPVAIYVGALIAGRGLEQAIDAAALVPGLRLRFVGPGEDGVIAALRHRALESGLGSRLEIPGPVPPDDVVVTLGSAAFGLNLIQPICLSYELTLPNKLFEYVAARLPVLSSDVPVCAAFVREHGIGEVVAADDPAAIADGMQRLLDTHRATAVRACLDVAAARFTWERERETLRGAYSAACA